MRKTRFIAAVAFAVAAATVLAGCTSSGQSANTDSNKPVTVDYWGWVPNIEGVITKWNKQNPYIQVKFSRIASNDATTKYHTSVQAGNAPCLAQASDEDILSYASSGLLQDVTSEAKQYKNNYLGWVWNQVSPGGKSYGLPQDTGPMVIYYRADLFQRYGVSVPKTWSQYAADAAKVHQADPSVVLGTLSPDDSDTFSAYASQNKAQWWSIDGNEWVADLTGSQTQTAASYWQKLVDSGDVSITDRWAPTFYQDMNNGTVISYIGAAWNAALIQQNVKSGEWRVAQMPVYNTSKPVTANSGGSAVAVLKGCKTTPQALKFANWLNTSEESMNVLASPSGGGLYPAAKQALDYSVVNKDVPFFGGQNIYKQFKISAGLVNQNWNWGPVADQMYTAIGDGTSSVANKQATLPSMLPTVQSTVVQAAKQKGISVKTAG